MLSLSLIERMLTIAGPTSCTSAEKSGRLCAEAIGFVVGTDATAVAEGVGVVCVCVFGVFGSHPAPSVAMRAAALQPHKAWSGFIAVTPRRTAGDEAC